MAKSNWTVGLVLASGLLLCSSGMALARPSDSGDRPTRQQRQEKQRDKGERGDRGERGEHPRGEGRHGQADGKDRHHAIKKMLFKDIELTADQKDQFRKLRENSKAQREAWREAHQDEIKAIREEMRTARQNKDREAAKAAHEKLRKLLADAPRPGDHLDKVEAILDPDQFTQFKRNLKAVKAKYEQRKAKYKHHMKNRENQKEDHADRHRKHHEKSRQQDDDD